MGAGKISICNRNLLKMMLFSPLYSPPVRSRASSLNGHCVTYKLLIKPGERRARGFSEPFYNLKANAFFKRTRKFVKTKK